MENYDIVGKCPKCGCPIYQPLKWAGSVPPESIYTCKCYEKTTQEQAMAEQMVSETTGTISIICKACNGKGYIKV